MMILITQEQIKGTNKRTSLYPSHAGSLGRKLELAKLLKERVIMFFFFLIEEEDTRIFKLRSTDIQRNNVELSRA